MNIQGLVSIGDKLRGHKEVKSRKREDSWITILSFLRHFVLLKFAYVNMESKITRYKQFTYVYIFISSIIRYIIIYSVYLNNTMLR